ncbi:MAG TPA: ABC transporter permease [Candidatus Dormibacteraeota bacterium]|nr:ABC transporter permease [Candidatus Dormibacteraeota bacterium]
MSPLWRRYEARLLLAIVFLLLLLAVTTPRFFAPTNLALLARSMGVLAILTLGMLCVLITGGIDVSVGSMLAVTSVVLARLGNHGISEPWTLIAVLLLGTGLGAFNGVLVALLRVPPIVATLGTLGLYRGLLLEWTQGEWESTVPGWLNELGRPRALRLDASVWTAALLALIAAAFLNRTQTGRNIFKYGSSNLAATRTGVSRTAVLFTVFAAMGFLTAVASIFYSAQLGSVQGNAAVGYELVVIAAVVLGGTDILGGRGSVFGTLLGVFLVSAIQTSLVLLHVPTYTQGIATGLILLGSVLLRRLPNGRSARVLTATVKPLGHGQVS